MTRPKFDIPTGVLRAYPWGVVRGVNVVSGGLIHQTYKIKAQKGAFVLQRLHPVLASPEVAKDFLAVTGFLKKNNFFAPECVLTRNGRVLVSDRKSVWRAQTFIAGKSYPRIKNLKMAREAGKIFARLHRTLDKMDYRFRSRKPLHQTEQIFADFQKTVWQKNNAAPARNVRREIGLISAELPKLFLPGGLPQRVIHGDPKISNILFDSGGRATTVVDLDTCNRRPLLVELGDAFRSWCGKAEDDPKNRFDLAVFRATWLGYAAAARGFILPEEKQYVSRAIGLITLELAARFLADYFNDNYFGWNPARYASRREHNLARARGQIALFLDWRSKAERVEKIIRGEI